MNIDQTRQDIINEKSHVLVQGGPGSGKTTIALEKAKALIDELPKSHKILFLSFSKSAVKQISDRAKDVLKDIEKSPLIIQTYHSFCWDILKSHFYLISSAKHIDIMPPHLEVITKNTYKGKNWGQYIEDEFTNNGRIVYDLFAPKVFELLSRSKSLQEIYGKSFPLIIVDEFQDSDEAQWSIVKLLSQYSQIMCLADPEQRIYEWRKGVRLKRIDDVVKTLMPKSYDFGNQNHRSPKSGVLAFANNLLYDPSKLSYPEDGSLKLFQYQVKQRPEFIKLALFSLIKKMPKDKKDWSIAVLVRTNQMVRSLSNGLDETHTFKKRVLEPFGHSVLIDENAVVLSGRVISYLLQPRKGSYSVDLVKTIEIFIDIFNSNLTKQNATIVDRLLKAIEKIKEDKNVALKLVKEIERIRDTVTKKEYLSGDPFQDWLKIRRELENSESAEISKIAKVAKQMRYLRKGTQITDKLSTDWKDNGSYLNALSDFDTAVYQAQISDSYTPHTGVVIMNIHKSKGKEFDGVILVDGLYNDSLTSYDKAPFTKSKRLVRVGLTRARTAAYILICRQYPSTLFPITSN